MRDRVDVAKLLERLSIEAKADGDEYIARCPAHEDGRPSWSINRHTAAHHCFSCGFGGGAAALVIHALDTAVLGWTRADAWEWMRSQGVLEGDGSLGLSVELVLRAPDRPSAFVLPRSVLTGPLGAWPSPASRYLAARGVPGWQVRRWGIGYAVDGRLGGRVVFPVRDRANRLLSYSARTFCDALVRYLTPDASENPDRSALFGEQGWPEPRERERVVVVEGALKALAVERANSSLCVAGVLGATQVSNPRVASKLATFRAVTILLDADDAGQKAADTLRAAIARYARVDVRRPKTPVDDAPAQEVREVLA
jgi:DNA primase